MDHGVLWLGVAWAHCRNDVRPACLRGGLIRGQVLGSPIEAPSMEKWTGWDLNPESRPCARPRGGVSKSRQRRGIFRFGISDGGPMQPIPIYIGPHIGYQEIMPIPISTADLPPVIWERVRSSLRDLDAYRPLPADVVKALRNQLRVLHTYQQCHRRKLPHPQGN